MAQQVNPWDDEALEKESLITALDPNAKNAPVSNTMPVTAPVKLAETAAAPETRTGWRGITLDTPTQANANRFEGFNDQRALAGGDEKSTKDAFRRWAGSLDQNFASMSKDDMGAFLRDQMDEMRGYGLNVSDVEGDKIFLDAAENEGTPGWVDIFRDAGGQGGAFQWLPDDENPNAEGTRAGNVDLSLLAALGNQPLAGGPTVGPAANDPMAEIMKEIEALQGGTPSPIDQQALMQLLGI